MKKRIIERGQVYFAHLGQGKGSEQGGDRPVLVVQNDMGNRCSPTVVIVPITSQTKTPLPTHVSLNKIPTLAATTCVLTEQIRTIDKSRLGTYLCQLNPEAMEKVDFALAISVGLVKKYNK